MTYMYELPQYVELPMSEEINATFPKYKLIVYGEGEGKKIDKLKKEKLTGIPVLFIPGNAGSVKQVRSLASVALRKAIDDHKYKIHFDYFSVDLKKSGLLSMEVHWSSKLSLSVTPSPKFWTSTRTMATTM